MQSVKSQPPPRIGDGMPALIMIFDNRLVPLRSRFWTDGKQLQMALYALYGAFFERWKENQRRSPSGTSLPQDITIWSLNLFIHMKTNIVITMTLLRTYHHSLNNKKKGNILKEEKKRKKKRRCLTLDPMTFMFIINLDLGEIRGSLRHPHRGPTDYAVNLSPTRKTWKPLPILFIGSTYSWLSEFDSRPPWLLLDPSRRKNGGRQKECNDQRTSSHVATTTSHSSTSLTW